MDVPEKQKDPDSKRLSLIDFSGEDDSLFNSPLKTPSNPKSSDKDNEHKSNQLSEFSHSSDNKKSEDLLQEVEDFGEPADFSEPRSERKNEKFNLRKSLAWDSAFFTSDGVLDPEELSCMIVGNEKFERQPLPGIQEDINVSCDSLTTLGSDALTLESLEADLFGDIRASIQKSKVSGNMNSSAKKESGVAETPTASSSKKVESASQYKINLKAALRKPSVSMQASGKSLKQVSVQPQVSKLVAKARESSSSLPKLAKVQTGITPIPKTLSKKDSIGPKLVKTGKDSKVVRATTKTPAIVASRNVIPRTMQHSRSSSYSSVSTKAELTTSCSSLDSCGSASSSSLPRSPLNSMKRKSDLKTVKNSSSSSTIANPLRPAARGKIQAGSSQISSLLKSVTSLSSSISSTSSINASESLSPVSAGRQRTNAARSSIGTGSCKGFIKSGDGTQANTSQVGLVKIAAAGTAKLAQPDSMKPSGLRMPSPKLGFFDGMKSLGRSPNAQSRPGIPNGLPRSGAGTVSPSGSSNKAIPGIGRTLTANQSSKTDIKQASPGNLRSSPLQKSSNPVKKTPISARRSSCHSPSISPILHKSSPRRAGSLSKDNGAVSNGKDNMNIALADKSTTLDAPDMSNTASLKDTNWGLTSPSEKPQGADPIRQVGVAAIQVDTETKKESLVNSSPAGGITEELVNGLSLLTLNSPLTTEVTAGTRIPLAAMECNVDGPVDISTGSAVVQPEKIATIPTLENILPEST